MTNEFPFLEEVEETYLDTAATAQVPNGVINALRDFYKKDNANVHRGLYRQAYETTEKYEAVRQEVARFINADDPAEIIFTRGTTESLNLVAQSYGERIEAGDELLVSASEHHSNFIPWQQLAIKTGAKLVIAPPTASGDTDVSALLDRITKKTKVLAVAQVTNVTGGLVDVKTLADAVHAQGGVIVVDAAQSAAHLPVDVHALDADFLAFSGHKLYGPTGIGVLYGRRSLLETMPPVEFGGEMIDWVQDESSTWAELPLKFEAGTPNIAATLGLGAALDFIKQQGWATIAENDKKLVTRLRHGLQDVGGITLYGSDDAIGIVSFNVQGVHAHDVATILDEKKIAVRAGHHCAQPLMARLGVPATVRASFGLYNTEEDVDRLLGAVESIKGVYDGFI